MLFRRHCRVAVALAASGMVATTAVATPASLSASAVAVAAAKDAAAFIHPLHSLRRLSIPSISWYSFDQLKGVGGGRPPPPPSSWREASFPFLPFDFLGGGVVPPPRQEAPRRGICFIRLAALPSSSSSSSSSYGKGEVAKAESDSSVSGVEKRDATTAEVEATTVKDEHKDDDEDGDVDVEEDADDVRNLDVNALKRNLVQRAMSEYKRELLDLLGGLDVGVSSAAGTNRAELIEEKLAAIAQANPVSTTTDSNLLEGEWEFVFTSSKNASAFLDPTRFLYSREQQAGATSAAAAASSSSSGNAAGTWTPPPPSSATSEGALGRGGRTVGWRLPVDRPNPLVSTRRRFRLGEDLADDEEPVVLEVSSYLGGLWEVRKTYRLSRLSRTALELELEGVAVAAVGGRRTWDVDTSGRAQRGRRWQRNIPRSEAIRVFYLDNDLCISTTVLRGSADVVPLQIYRRFGEKASAGRVGMSASANGGLRYLGSMASWLWAVESPLRFRRRFADTIFPLRRLRRRKAASAGGGDASRATMWSKRLSRGEEEEENRMVVRRSRKDEDEKYRLLVLKLGEYGINEDGTLREDEAWDGDEDPFVHLSAMERQEVMRRMKIKDIIEAGRKRKEEGDRRGVKRRRFWEQKKFVRPSSRGKGGE